MASISTYIEKELKLRVNMEKSMVTRPWLNKLLGFTFYHKKGTKAIAVHRKSISSYKDKIRLLTDRSKPYAMEERTKRIRELNYGWGNYFKLSEAKSVFRDLDSWVRSRLRLCYWKQWKTGKTRAGNLRQLGVRSYQAHQWAYTRKGYWRTVHSPILASALNNTFLKEAGFVSLKDITSPPTPVNV